MKASYSWERDSLEGPRGRGCGAKRPSEERTLCGESEQCEPKKRILLKVTLRKLLMGGINWKRGANQLRLILMWSLMGIHAEELKLKPCSVRFRPLHEHRYHKLFKLNWFICQQEKTKITTKTNQDKHGIVSGSHRSEKAKALLSGLNLAIEPFENFIKLPWG